MFSALAFRPQILTKRILVYCAWVSVSFLAALLFVFHGRVTASKNIPSRREAPAAPAQIQPALVASYGKLPLSFEVNRGQTESQVKFLSRGRGYTLFLTGDEAVLALEKRSAISPQLSATQISRRESWRPFMGIGKLLALSGTLQRTTDDGQPTSQLIQDPKSKIENEFVRLRLVGARPNAKVTGSHELPGKANYFIGNDPKKWRTNVPTYARVRYQNVYPGVDLEYYGNQGGQLECDFVVAPGADPSAITLDVAAGRGRPRGSPLRIAADGDLVISTEGGEAHFRKPVVYQPTGGPVQRATHHGPRTAPNPKSKIG